MSHRLIFLIFNEYLFDDVTRAVEFIPVAVYLFLQQAFDFENQPIHKYLVHLQLLIEVVELFSPSKLNAVALKEAYQLTDLSDLIDFSCHETVLLIWVIKASHLPMHGIVGYSSVIYLPEAAHRQVRIPVSGFES